MTKMGDYGRYVVINEVRKGFRWMHSGGDRGRDVCLL
jgi:hypothetical protein